MKQKAAGTVCAAMMAAVVVSLAMIMGCDAPEGGEKVGVESTPQPPANPLDAMAADSVAEDQQREKAIDVDASITSFQQKFQGERNTSLPAASKQERDGRATTGSGSPNESPPAQRVDRVKLSAGVALPQSLPTGTAIGLSIDYEVIRALPGSAKQVIWVIEAGGNQKVEFPVQLDQSRGNLMTFARDLKPRHAPFRCHMQLELQDGTRQVISPSVPMRY